jgi:hypothetical protein
MKKYIARALLMVLGTAYLAYARWSVGAAGGGAAVAGGPDAWYESGTGTTESYGGTNTVRGHAITPDAGTMTQIRGYIGGDSGARTCKMALFTLSGSTLTLVSGCTGTVTAANGTVAALDCTLTTPTSSNGSTAYVVGWDCDGDIMYFRSAPDTGIYGATPYSTFPQASIADNSTDGGAFRVGIYVD